MNGDRLFRVVSSNRRRGNGYRLEHKKFHKNMRKIIFTLRVTVMELAARFPVMETSAQGCGVSDSEDIQDLPGYCLM